jgi:shikimate kinase
MGAPRLDRHILLIGLRASGKSTLGRALATALGGVPFVDLDDHTREALGATTVREAFLDAGEAGFRAAEAQALARALRSGEAHVLALGGGTPTAPGAAEQIAEARREGRAFVVFLDPPLSTLAERLTTHEGDRPSLTGRGVVAEIGDVAAVRRPLYAALADLRLLEPLDEASLVSIITSQVGSASATADA